MLRHAAMLIFGSAAVLLAEGGKADSVVYQTEDVQWNTYPSAQAVKAFAFDGTTLWYTDGVAFKSLNTAKKRLSEAPSVAGVNPADVTCMAADNAGAFWFGTQTGVVMMTAKANTRFTAQSGLADDGVLCIAGVGARVWVGTAKGASCYSAGAWKTYTSKDGLIDDKINCICTDDPGRTWFGTQKGISSFDGGMWKSYSMKTGLSWNNTQALGFDRKAGILWAAVGESDINAWDGKEWRQYISIQAGITSILVDTQSRIWFGHEGGLVKFNGDEWVNDPGKLGVTVSQVNQMLRDAQGNLWFGTEKGVVKMMNPYPH